MRRDRLLQRWMEVRAEDQVALCVQQSLAEISSCARQGWELSELGKAYRSLLPPGVVCDRVVSMRLFGRCEPEPPRGGRLLDSVRPEQPAGPRLHAELAARLYRQAARAALQGLQAAVGRSNPDARDWLGLSQTGVRWALGRAYTVAGRTAVRDATCEQAEQVLRCELLARYLLSLHADLEPLRGLCRRRGRQARLAQQPLEAELALIRASVRRDEA